MVFGGLANLHGKQRVATSRLVARMKGLEICDTDANGGLAFDLAEVVAVLGQAVLRRTWIVGHVECTGTNTSTLQSHAGSADSLDGAVLVQLSAGIRQVINGEFLGTLRGEQVASLVIRAVDSTFWEVFAASDALDAIAQGFVDVRPARFPVDDQT